MSVSFWLQLHGAIYRPDSFVLMLRYCVNLKAIRYESTSFHRIVADKSHRVIVAYLIIARLRNVNLLCFSDSIEGIDFLNCTLKCPVTLKLANQTRYFY